MAAVTAASPFAKVLQYATLLESGVVHAELGSHAERTCSAEAMRTAVRKAAERSGTHGTRRQQMAGLFQQANELLDSGAPESALAASFIRECFAEREWKEALPWLFSAR